MQGKSVHQVNARLNQALENIVDNFAINDHELISYLRNSLPQLLPRLHLALTERTLEQLFITDQPPLRAGQLITLEAGTSLEDEEFRELIAQVLECSSSKAKVGLILNRIHSWTDFYDVLNADCLFADDYPLLWAALGDLELVMLIKEVGAEAIREGKFEVRHWTASFSDTDYEWERQLVIYINSLSPQRLRGLESLINDDLQILE